MVMNLPSEGSAEEMLELFGFSRNAAGEYSLGDDEEARLLRLAEDEVFYTLRLGLENEQDRLDRLTTLFRTGDPPPPIELSTAQQLGAGIFLKNTRLPPSMRPSRISFDRCFRFRVKQQSCASRNS